MRDDFVPPATTQEQRDAADLHRLRQKNVAVRRWHELAVSMGFDGVEPALLSLQGMVKGPRPVPRASAEPSEVRDIEPLVNALIQAVKAERDEFNERDNESYSSEAIMLQKQRVAHCKAALLAAAHQSAPPAALNVAPIARVEIIGGEVSQTEIYAPGLPDGAHDLFPVPLNPNEPKMDDETVILRRMLGAAQARIMELERPSQPPSDRHRLELRLAFDKWMATRDPQALSEIAMLINAVCGATVTKSDVCADCGHSGDLINFNGQQIHEVCPADETSVTQETEGPTHWECKECTNVFNGNWRTHCMNCARPRQPESEEGSHHE